jgi:hypothetical protein
MRAEMNQRFDMVERRFEPLQKKIENIRLAYKGESVLGRYVAAAVEKRLQAIEKRLTSLEKQR